MTIFLLIISFIIDGLLILGMITLATRLKKSEELELRQEQVAKEIEDLFTSYLMEIKEENSRMSQLFEAQSASYNAKEHGGTKSSNSLPEDRPNPSQNHDQDQELVNEPTSYREYTPPEPPREQTSYQPSLHSQVFALRNEGYSIEEIAKKLDKGKTEIELLVKFQHKN